MNTIGFDSIGDFQQRVQNGVVTTASSIHDAGFAEHPRVLLADDHPAMLALTAAALAGEYCVAGSVGNGRELLAEAERLHPDVIVLDITMPRLDGIEAARQLRCSQRLSIAPVTWWAHAAKARSIRRPITSAFAAC